jgi:NADH-quinone oxidoreductase subunit M
LYMLWTYERVWFGPITHAVNETMAELSGREIAVMVPVIALMLLMGLFPRPLISRMEPSVTAMLARGNFAQAHLDTEHPPNRLAALLPASTHEPEIAAAAR